MSTSRKIFINTFLQIVGKVGVGIFGVLVSMFLARYVTLEERGLYEYTYTFLGFAGIIADLGLYTIAIKELAAEEKHIERTLSHIMGLRLLLGAVMLLGAVLLVLLVPQITRGWGIAFVVALLFGGISTVFALLTGAMTSILQVKYDMMHSTIGQIMGKAVIFVTMLLGMFVLFPKAGTAYNYETSFWGFQMLFIAGVIGNIVMYLYTWYFVRKYTPVRFALHRRESVRIVKQALPYALALVLGTLYFKVDALLLAYVLPEAIMKKELALYSASIKVLEIFTILPLFFLNSLLPILTIHAKAGGQKLSDTMQMAFQVLLIMSLPIVVGGMMLAPEIIRFTNSDAYISSSTIAHGSDVYLRILIVSLVFSALNLLCNFLLVARGEQQKILYVNALVLLFNVLANLITIPYWGVLAAAWITVCTEVLVFLLLLYFAMKSVSFRVRLMPLLYIGGCAGIMAAVIHVLSFTALTRLPLFFYITVSGGGALVIFLLVLILCGVISLQDIRGLLRKKSPAIHAEPFQ